MPTAMSAYRLLVSAERWARLWNLPELPLLQEAGARLAAEAEPWVTDRSLPLDETAHNWHLIRARHVQTRVLSLLVRYGVTGDRRYRDAALDYVRDMAGWEYWSWIKWREGDASPDAIFDLSYGENATTLAFAFDWLAAELSEEERALLVDTGRARALRPYLARNGTPGEEMWYYRQPDCNWNTVCNGGAGLLALVLGELAPESGRVLELVEEGVRHYFEFLQDDGAWPEGIGYWGYGHRYGYLYLLSHERATGRTHPLLERPGSRATLRFPFLFSPNRVSTGFGDSNHFFPEPFVYAAAERYGLPEIVAEMDRRAGDPAGSDECWPIDAELLLFHPGETPVVPEWPWPRTSVQQGVEWSYLADAWPKPSLYVSARGGNTDAPHTHQDLTSLWVVVGDETLVVNVCEDDYLDTTFSRRRDELYEMGAASKNVMLVNGVGLPRGAVQTRTVSGPGWEGVVLDATEIAAVGSPVDLYARAVLMLEGNAVLVLDRVAMHHAGLGEVRYHTRARTQWRRASARLLGEARSLHLAFAANVPAQLDRGQGLPTSPTREPETILRWRTDGKHRELVLATLLNAGRHRPARSERLAAHRARDGARLRGDGRLRRTHGAAMTPKERLVNTLTFRSVDRIPNMEIGLWGQTLRALGEGGHAASGRFCPDQGQRLLRAGGLRGFPPGRPVAAACVRGADPRGERGPPDLRGRSRTHPAGPGSAARWAAPA